MSTRLLTPPPVVRESVDPADFRAAMAALAAPVTVVTCYDDLGVPRGMTVSAASSLSLDPPLFLVCLDRRAGSHDALVSAPFFCVHVLGPGDEDLAMRFAGPADRRFTHAPLLPGPDPAPELAAGVRLTCARYAVRDGGDHSILIGRVTEVDAPDGARGGLVWHQRAFAS
ncbi:flavin reductase family protein [Streptomyces griseoruber]|uniref:Flavin reductase n=1 Tax=Streptomyces griseoruber TaxID=1943 RepID=A0A117R7J5_9ACTN|nr:flavin reductase family protein [Streptomyces griseoruber]KUN75283.1 flavin reductase [Streptomyces griseoruber]